VKKKLAALDMRVQVGGVVLGLLLLTAVAYKFVVAPQGAKASKLQAQVDSTQSLISQRRRDLQAAGRKPTIAVADLFKLSRAMPDRTDMPGIILTLSHVAREAGIDFDLIEPVAASTTAAVTVGFEAQRIHLLFNGDFYGLSDFLYRLRSLVAVRDGKLAATGRLLNTDTVIFNVDQESFPKISAELYVNAYVYKPAVAAPATPVPGTETTPETDPAAEAPTGATAAGAAR
jgi:Tfp pilus assembly protein PilO